VSVFLGPAGSGDDGAYPFEISRNEAAHGELIVSIKGEGLRLKGNNFASLPLAADGGPAVQAMHFLLTALNPGPAVVEAEIFVGADFKKSLRRKLSIVGVEGASLLPQLFQAGDRPVPEPDLLLQVSTIWSEDHRTLTYHYRLEQNDHPAQTGEADVSPTLDASWLSQARGWLADARSARLARRRRLERRAPCRFHRRPRRVSG
jgi:hypothetical protein